MKSLLMTTIMWLIKNINNYRKAEISSTIASMLIRFCSIVSRSLSVTVLSSNVSYEQAFILKNLYDVNVYLKDKDKDIFVSSTLVQTYLKKAWGK